jgi:hypothetical protein
MPLARRNSRASTGACSGEKPVVFQQYFKNGNRTYVSQVKISQTGRRYLVLTEGVRDPQTQVLKKHTICVFEQDLKQFFAILQDTVLYLRSAKDPSGAASATAAKPAEFAAPANGAARPSVTPRASANGGTVRTASPPPKALSPAKPLAQAKPAMREGAARPNRR